MKDGAEIRRPYLAEGLLIKAIVRRLTLSRNTVRNAQRDVMSIATSHAARPAHAEPALVQVVHCSRRGEAGLAR